MRERSDGTNKEEDVMKEWGKKRSHRFPLKPKNSKSHRQKVHKRDPQEEEKKESTTVCTLTNSYSSRRADLTR